MKKSLSAAIMLAAATFGYAQVGINTSTPASTLDITAKNSTGTSKNVDGLLVPRVDRERAQSMSSIPTSTLIYVNSINKGTQTGNAVNVDAVGYYYFDGNVWVKLNAGSGSGSSVNIYNSDGTLTGNRTVTQGDKTLTFNATATNAFSVDGKTFSVDAANDRVGIGTDAPTNTLDVNGTARVRTMNSTPKKVLVTPVYADANGVLVKANPANVNQLLTNSVQVAPGATGTLINGLPIGSMFKIAITVYDGCTNTALAEYYVGMSGKGMNAINAISGMLINNSSSPNFTKVNAATTKTTWTGLGTCQSGGGGNNFDYTLSIPAGGTINIQNNGNVTNEYYVVITRMDPV